MLYKDKTAIILILIMIVAFLIMQSSEYVSFVIQLFHGQFIGILWAWAFAFVMAAMLVFALVSAIIVYRKRHF